MKVERYLAMLESMLATSHAEGHDDLAIRLKGLIDLLRKERLGQIQKELATLKLRARYKRAI
jgi:hypothetical protein